MPLTASERATSTALPIRTAWAALMALLMLALLGIAQAEVSASTVAASGGPGVSVARQGDAVALLRPTGKAHAVEVRAGRPLPIKLPGGHSGAFSSASDFLVVGLALPAEPDGVPALAAALRSSANQPRAPPAA